MKNLFAAPLVLLLFSLLASCDSSSSSDERDPSDDPPAPVSGLVVDAVSGAPLAGVIIGAEDGSGETAVSDADGSFEFGELRESDAPTLRFVLDGYREELYARPNLGDGGTGPNPRPSLGDGEGGPETISMVPDDNAGEGGLNGTVSGPDGQPIANAILRFLRGIYLLDGDALATTDTAADGSWAVTGLPYGNYTCIVLVAGQEPIYRIVQVYGGVERGDQGVVAPSSVAPGPAPAPVPDPQDPLAIGPDEIRFIVYNKRGVSTYESTLIRPDGTVIDWQSPEAFSGIVRFMGIDLDGGEGRGWGMTLPLSFAEGAIYRVEPTVRVGFGSLINRNDVEVRIVGPDGLVETYEAPEDRTYQWTVFRVENGQFVRIDEEPAD